MQILTARWGSLWQGHPMVRVTPHKGPTMAQGQVEEEMQTFSLQSGLGLDATNPRWWQWLPQDMLT
eukprot:3670481-Prorocentrum_lima.AAC.1